MVLRFGLALAVVAGILSTVAPTPTPTVAKEAAAEAKKDAEIKRAARRLRPIITAQPLMPPPLPVRKTANSEPVPPVPDTWTDAELRDAKAQCDAALKNVDAEVKFEAPIKEGLCGNPAPIRLSRLGKVTFKPAALINCGLLQPLDTWIKNDVQPAAKRKLGSRVTMIEVMSDYSCRTAFGRVGRRLSQHAYVDALDIRGFVTGDGQRVHVLDAWGATKRDIVAAAKAKAKEEAKAQEAKLAAAQQQAERDEQADKDEKVSQRGLKGTMAANAARLGGPEGPLPQRKPAAPAWDTQTVATLSPATVGLPPIDQRGTFLREAHAAACRIFGTTLGPEANEAHRNHFHVDMAKRRIKNICD